MAALVEGRKLKLTLVSAENLPDVRNFGQMKVYAVVSLNGKTKITGAAMAGETNPTWNFVARYTVEEAAVQLPEVSILVKLWCERSLGDRPIGEVKIGVKNLFESHRNILRYRVAGTPDGMLNISCSFGPKMAVSAPRPDAARPRRQSSSSGKKVLKKMMSLGLSLADELFNGDDHASHVHESSSSDKKVLKMMMSLGLSLADKLFNGDDHASHVHDQNDHHGYDQEDGDEGDDDEDGGSCNDDQDDDDEDEDEDDDEDGGSCNDDEDDDDDEDEDEDEDD